MKPWIAFGACHALLSVSGWYWVGAAAQGSADGTGTAPAWLSVVNECVLVLLFPLGRIALWLDPLFGGFTLGAFAQFLVVTLLNSAVVTVAAWCVIGARRNPGAPPNESS